MYSSSNYYVQDKINDFVKDNYNNVEFHLSNYSIQYSPIWGSIIIPHTITPFKLSSQNKKIESEAMFPIPFCGCDIDWDDDQSPQLRSDKCMQELYARRR